MVPYYYYHWQRSGGSSSSKQQHGRRWVTLSFLRVAIVMMMMMMMVTITRVGTVVQAAWTGRVVVPVVPPPSPLQQRRRHPSSSSSSCLYLKKSPHQYRRQAELWPVTNPDINKMNVIDCFPSDARAALLLLELSSSSKIPKINLHRIISTLGLVGFVVSMSTFTVLQFGITRVSTGILPIRLLLLLLPLLFLPDLFVTRWLIPRYAPLLSSPTTRSEPSISLTTNTVVAKNTTGFGPRLRPQQQQQQQVLPLMIGVVVVWALWGLLCHPQSVVASSSSLWSLSWWSPLIAVMLRHCVVVASRPERLVLVDWYLATIQMTWIVTSLHALRIATTNRFWALASLGLALASGLDHGRNLLRMCYQMAPNNNNNNNIPMERK